MDIYENDPNLLKALERIGQSDMNFFNVNYCIKSRAREFREGLGLALKYLGLESNEKLILYGYDPAYELFQDERFQRLMARSNTHFLRLPFNKKDLYQELLATKPENVALRIMSERNYKLARLHEALVDCTRGYGLPLAKQQLGYEPTVSQLREILNNPESLPRDPIGHLPGLFVEVVGSLFIDSKINEYLLLCISVNRPESVTLWTDQDLQETIAQYGPRLEEICSENGLILQNRAPILSKNDFRGSSPEHVIDHATSKEDFEKKFGIKPQTYTWEDNNDCGL